MGSVRQPRGLSVTHLPPLLEAAVRAAASPDRCGRTAADDERLAGLALQLSAAYVAVETERDVLEATYVSVRDRDDRTLTEAEWAAELDVLRDRIAARHGPNAVPAPLLPAAAVAA